MKVTIGGRRYDTERSIRIGEVASEYGTEGPLQYKATLYRKPRTNEVFLHGWGGFMTRFRDEERIVILSETEARVMINMKVNTNVE